jgi:hypothetical protein
VSRGRVSKQSRARKTRARERGAKEQSKKRLTLRLNNNITCVAFQSTAFRRFQNTPNSKSICFFHVTREGGGGEGNCIIARHIHLHSATLLRFLVFIIEPSHALEMDISIYLRMCITTLYHNILVTLFHSPHISTTTTTTIPLSFHALSPCLCVKNLLSVLEKRE